MMQETTQATNTLTDGQSGASAQGGQSQSLDKAGARRSGHTLSQEDRARGGKTSAAQQTRDAFGQFAGKNAGQRSSRKPEGESQ